jgi:hypothetical protein
LTRARWAAGLAVLLVGSTGPSAEARVVRVSVDRREPVLDGRDFGAAGPYEKLVGTVEFALDPSLRQNQAIVDLALAPRDARGEVVFSADFYVLKPVDLRRGDGLLYYEVPNRGGKAILRRLQFAEGSLDPTTAAQIGDGWLMRQGMTLAWMGWQWDVPERPGLLRLRAPVASEQGRPITGLVRAMVVPDHREEVAPLGDRDHLAYPPTGPRGGDDRLYVRDHALDQPRLLPRARWHFVGEDALALDGGFEPGRIYEVVYRSRDPRVVGCGLAATRDLVSFFRNEAGEANPLAGVRLAIAHGISQSGRFLRHFLYQGLNEDEQGRRVFDGMFIEVAGAGRGSFNHRFAQASRDGYQHFNVSYPTDLFPFTDLPEEDPQTAERAGLLDRARARGTVPRLFHVMTAFEYWNRAASLVHTDATGQSDAALPDTSRIYFIASAQHGPGRLPPLPGGVGSNLGFYAANANETRPLLRALVRALVEWVAQGTQPPPSQYPRIDSGTLVTPERAGWPAVPGVRFPLVRNQPARLDFGPGWRQGVVSVEPPRLGPVYPTLVPAVDDVGDDRAGVRMPAIEVPLATQTGWNWRHPSTGAPSALVGVLGSYLPLPWTKSERERTADPRLSVEERYRGREDFLGRVTLAALSLVRARFLLASDVPLVVENARAEWDERAAAAHDEALSELVEAERSFARDSVARGIRNSFLAAFAEDGVNFTPRPQVTRAALLAEKEPEPPPTVELDWAPVLADVAWSGELGYTTGPWILRDRGPAHRPARHGYYFSIWKRLADGTFRVAVDAGTSTPEPRDEGFERAYRPAPGAASAPPAPAADGAREREAALEAALLDRGPTALASYCAPEARLHRDGAFPALGLSAVRAALAEGLRPVSFELRGSGEARSGELAYAWGEVRFEGGATGSFVRVWRRDAQGVFRVTLDWGNVVAAK